MKFIALASTLFLAALFLFTGIDKVFHYTSFVNALESYHLVPSGFAGILAPVVIAVEVAVGLGLLVRPWRATAALAGALMLGLFTAALIANQFYAPGNVCGCWFTVTLAESTGSHIGLNAVLIALSLTTWWTEREGKEEARPPLAPSAEIGGGALGKTA